MRRFTIPLFVAMFASATAAQSQNTPNPTEHDCNTLAAHSTHPETTSGAGVSMLDMDVPAAIAACRIAVAADPENARLNFQLGRALDIGKQFEEAGPFYQKAIDLGDPVAMVNFAWKYQHGEGVDQSSAKFFELTKMASEAGYGRGLLAHGEAYWFGYGTEINDEAALGYFRRAAEQGDATAMQYIGQAYKEGRGVAENVGEAIAWADRAGEAGNADAWIDIGNLYFDGDGVDADKEEAFAWYMKSADVVYGEGQGYVAWAYQNGEGVAEDPVKAREWYKRAADQGVLWAADNLADMYYFGTGGETDYLAALALWEMMQASGEEDYMAIANHSIAWLYREGDGVEQSYAKAMDFFQAAAAAGYGRSHESIATLYAEGLGVVLDYGKAYAWRLKGAELGDLDSMYGLAAQLHSAKGIARDDVKALELLNKVISEGEGRVKALATNVLGIAYEMGRGVEPDIARALALYREAGTLGDPNGTKNLASVLANENYGVTDYAEAFRLYSKMYEEGVDPDHGGLGGLFEHGKGVDANLDRAIALYREGIEADDSESHWRLAMLYAAGKGVEEDDTKAKELFEASVTFYSLIGYYHMALAYETGLMSDGGAEFAAEMHEKALAVGRNDALIRDPADWSVPTLQALQKRLKTRGIYQGPIDGIMTIATMNAMRTLFAGG